MSDLYVDERIDLLERRLEAHECQLDWLGRAVGFALAGRRVRVGYAMEPSTQWGRLTGPGLVLRYDADAGKLEVRLDSGETVTVALMSVEVLA